MTTEAPPISQARTTVAGTVAFVVSAMPAFLTGASGVFLREDLGFGATGLGLAVSAYFAAFAVVSVLGGRTAERLGASRALKLTSLGAALVMLAIAGLVRDLATLVAVMAIGGLVNSVAEPASNLALARRVVRRPATMFGIKQAAMPMATLLAGASVPLLGLTVGWRWTFVVGAALAGAVALWLPSGLAPPRKRTSGRAVREGDAATGPLVALAAAAGVGSASATALSPFLVGTAVESGMGVGPAGWLLVLGGLAAVLARPLAGWYADRGQGRAMYAVATMMFVGAFGYAMIAVGGPPFLVVGSVVAFSFGWGWMGLLVFAVVRLNPNAPAAASGIMLTGGASGAALGPFAFGVLVTTTSYPVAWSVAAAGALVAMVLVLFARGWLHRDRDRRAANSDQG
jgi:predicted MFS family arabinose efflux permease